MRASVFLALLLLAPTAGRAEVRAGDTGVGIILGEPSGLSGKLFLSRRHAFDAGLSFSVLDDAFYAHVDYLLHFPKSMRGFGGGQWLPYAGVGGQFEVHQRRDDGHAGMGARLPVGLAWHPANSPLDFFVELALGMKLFPATRPSFGGGFGVRLYL